MFARWSAYWKERYAAVEQETYALAHRLQTSYVVTKITGFGQAIINDRNVRNFTQGLFDPLWHLPEALIAIRDKPKVRQVFKQTLYSSSKILGVSFIYYNGARPFLVYCGAAEDSTTLAATDNMVHVYLLAQIPRLFVEDAINSVSLADTFSELMPKGSTHFECNCDVLEKRHGNFNTNIHYLTHNLLLFGASHLQHVGCVIEFALTPWFIGQSNMDYRLNMCDPHRYRQISLNNFYLAGNGAAVQLGTLAVCYLIGVDRRLSLLAIRALVMKIGMLTTVLRVAPLPGHERARDLSYYVRYAGEHFVQNRVNDLNKYLRQKHYEQLALANTNPQRAEVMLSEQIFGHIKTNMSTWVTFFIGPDYAHLQSLVRTGPLRLLIEMKKDQITAALDGIQGARNYPVMVIAAVKVSKWLPQNFLPSGVTYEDLRFFKRVVFLNGVKQALPLIADLVGHALRDPAIIAASEPLEQLDLGMGSARIVELDDYLGLDSQIKVKIRVPEEDKIQQDASVVKLLPAPVENPVVPPPLALSPVVKFSTGTTLALLQSPMSIEKDEKPPEDEKDKPRIAPLSNSIVDVNPDYYTKLSSSAPVVRTKAPPVKHSIFGKNLRTVTRALNTAPKLLTQLGKELGFGK